MQSQHSDPGLSDPKPMIFSLYLTGPRQNLHTHGREVKRNTSSRASPKNGAKSVAPPSTLFKFSFPPYTDRDARLEASKPFSTSPWVSSRLLRGRCRGRPRKNLDLPWASHGNRVSTGSMHKMFDNIEIKGSALIYWASFSNYREWKYGPNLYWNNAQLNKHFSASITYKTPCWMWNKQPPFPLKWSHKNSLLHTECILKMHFFQEWCLQFT